jgi:hypothetical protein
VAVCPTCHDAIHHGPLKIDDATVRRWKDIERRETERDHVYVEPAEAPKLLLGTIAVMGTDAGVTVFELGGSSKPGHVRLTGPPTSNFMPTWALKQMRQHEPEFAPDNVLTLLDLEVLEPGLVRVQGVWSKDYRTLVVITPTTLSFVKADLVRPLSLMGDGAASVLYYVGPLTTALFGFG